MIGRHILVVEDDRTTRDLLRAILTAKGLEVVVAATLAEGMRLLDPPPDVLLLDLSLPDGDGAELLWHVRSAGLPIRVAVTTGYDPTYMESVMEMEPVAVLQKPIDVEEFCRICGLTT